MQKNQHCFTNSDGCSSPCRATVLLMLGFTALAQATEPALSPSALASDVIEAEFDSTFLIGDAKKIDTTRFKYGNPVLPGNYSVDIYVNGNWFGKHPLRFKATENNQNASTCFSATQLQEYGVKAEALKPKMQQAPLACQTIEQWLDDAFYVFDTSTLRLDISIPQAVLQKNVQGYVDPSVWDRGINAAFLSYNTSYYKTFNQVYGDQETTHAFSSITAGANIAGWQLRHNGQWQWQDRSAKQPADHANSHYQSTSSYVQRALPDYNAKISLGDNFTNGEVFDSFAYRGLHFASDDRMLPTSMLGYAPRIRGNAKTNAKVEIRQQGQLIYQTTVAAGNFEINDLYPTGFGGELEVAVFEANGEVQKYLVPYASVVQMLRPGMQRYSITMGQFRDNHFDLEPFIMQGTYQRGINNWLTTYGGVQYSPEYTALNLGSAFATALGAISLDLTHSQTKFNEKKNSTGQSVHFSYNKLISSTNTNLTLAAYRYSTEHFYTLRDALASQNLQKKGITHEYDDKQRSEFQFTLNQGIAHDWGNIYATGSWIDYWNRKQATRQYQVGYSQTFHGLTFGLSAIKHVVVNNALKTRHNNTEYMMTLSLPLSFKKNALNINSVTTQDNSTLGISGVLSDRFNYSTSFSAPHRDNPSWNVNSQYRSNYLTLGSSYAIADQYQQVMLSAQGNIVAHAKGVLFGPDKGQTMVLVYAPEASGAKVNNAVGLSINKSGYAVIPYVTPYRLNDVSLDPQGMSTDVELEATSHQIAPYADAIAQVNFSTKTGQAIYIRSAMPNGGALPFGAEVFNDQGEHIGIVAQGSLVYLRTHSSTDTITVQWGQEPSEQCRIHYKLPFAPMDKKQNMVMIEGVCQ